MKPKKDTKHKYFTPAARKMLDKYSDVTLKFKLDEICKEKGLTFLDVSNLTGIRNSTLAELNHGKKGTLNIHHLILLSVALGVDSISELIELEMTAETREELLTRRYGTLDDEQRKQLEAGKRYNATEKKGLNEEELNELYEGILANVESGK